MNQKLRSRREWESILEEFATSGLNRKEFCLRKGLSYSAFSAFISRRKGKGTKKRSRRAKTNRKQEVGGFVGIEVPALCVKMG